jgi:2-oxoglutarate dehydrogenase E1 component
MNTLKDKKGKFNIFNSLLSEYGVLGFEYGYAFAAPNTLTIWEAQFGDFANNSQCIIDQFIASGEKKWHQRTGFVPDAGGL